MSTTSTSTTIRANVTSGPGAADMVHSFLYAYSPSRIPVHFTVEIETPGRGTHETEFDAIVTGLRYESGSYGMFIIEFYVASHSGWGNCSGFYDAQRRHGWFDMTAL